MNRLLMTLTLGFALGTPISAGLITIVESEPIIVTSSPWYKAPNQLGFKSQLVSRKKIEQTGSTSISDLLNQVTNISGVNSAHKNSLFIRGLPSRFSKIMINGLDTKDPIEPNGSPFWDGLNLSSIDEIQYVEGTQGALLGPSAITGALNFVVNPRGTESTIKAGSEYYQMNFKTGQETKTGEWSLSASREYDNRFSAKAGTTAPDVDPYSSNNLLGRMVFKTDDMRLSGQFMTVHTISALDNFGPGNDELTTHITRLGSSIEWGHSTDQQTGVRYTGSWIKRDDPTAAYTSQFRSMLHGFDLYSNAALSERATGTFGIGYEIENGSNSQTGARFQNSASAYSGIGFSVNPDIQLNGSLRVISDYANRAGISGGLGAVVTLNAHSQLRANINSGFRSPSIFENSNTDATLKPEKATSFDLGIWENLGWMTWNLSGYYSIISDRIKDTYLPAPSYALKYVNLTKQTHIKGFEVGANFLNIGQVKYLETASSTEVSDYGTGEARIPRFKWIASTFQTLGPFTVNVQFQSVGSRVDNLYSNTLLSEYAVTDVSLAYKEYKYWTPFVAINNVFDHPYELASGYTPGSRTFIAGLTYRVE